MSHTVIVDEGERSRQVENQINKAVRRCRVRVKRWKYVWPSTPYPFSPYPKHVPDKWVFPQSAGAPPFPTQWWQNPVISTC